MTVCIYVCTPMSACRIGQKLLPGRFLTNLQQKLLTRPVNVYEKYCCDILKITKKQNYLDQQQKKCNFYKNGFNNDFDQKYPSEFPTKILVLIVYI